MPEPKLKGKLSLDDSQFARALRKGEDSAKGFGNKVKAELANLASPLAAIAPAVAAAFTGDAIWDGVKGVFAYGRELRETSEQTGIAVGKLFILQKQFKDAGLDADTASMSVARLQKFLYAASTTGEGSDKLSELHLSAYKLRQLAPEEQLRAIGLAIGRLEDPEQRAALAMEFFGKSGAKLLAVFKNPQFGTAGSRQLQEKAEMLQRNAELYEQASIKLEKVGDIFKGFYGGLADRVAGPLIAILDRVESGNLVGVGQQFGDYLVDGALAVVTMLQGIKKADLVSLAKEFGMWLKWGAEQIGDILGGFKAMFAQDIKDLRAAAAALGLPDPFPDQPGAANPAAAAKPDETKPADGGTVDPVVVSGWHNPLDDDQTETGLRAAARMGRDPSEATGRLETGGLGTDTASDARQRLSDIRDQVKWQNPLLTGGALNNAVNAEDKRQRDAEKVRQYRETHGGVHADKDAGNKNPATEAGQAATTKKVDELITAIKTLVSS